MLGCLGAGYVVAFYLVATRLFGGWVPLDTPYTNLYATPLPFLAALSAGVSPAVIEEFLFRLIGVGLFLKLTRNRFIALLVPGAIWAFAHLGYVRDPFYLRGVELTIDAVLLFGLFFLRFDLTTTMVAHFAFNAGATALPLLRSSDEYFVASGVLVIGAMLAPVIPGLVLAIRRRLRGKARAVPLVTISPAAMEDVAALETLPIPDVPSWNALLKDPSAAVVCLREGERLAGVAAGRVDKDGVGHVLALFVVPDLRRRYWGSALVDTLNEALRTRGAQSVTVEAAAADRAVRAFWSAQGFELSTTVYSRPFAPVVKTGWGARLRWLIEL
jgi:ribosomal protein S18 acetylase RimI-like enzyme